MRSNWKTKPLLGVCTKITDGSHYSPKTVAVGYPYITVRDISNDVIDFERCKFISKESYNDLKRNGCNPEEGDVLFSKDGTVGKVSLVNYEKDFAVLSSLAILRPDQQLIQPEYLKYYMKEPTFLKQAVGRKTGAAIRRIVLRNLKSIPLSYPPLPEQKRIVEVLDEAFEAIDKATANTEKNVKNAKELFERLLDNVFSQENLNWNSYLLKEITMKIGSGATPRGGAKSYKQQGISLIRSMNVYDRHFKKLKLAFIDNQQANKLSNVVVENNDVLFNITGASVTRCCVVDNEVLPARVNQHVSILRPTKNHLSPEFLCYLLTSTLYKNKLLDIGGKGGSTRQAITKNQLENLTVLIPGTLHAQNKMVSKLKEVESYCGHLSLNQKKKVTELALLKQSILQKAFTGELTKDFEAIDKALSEAAV